MEHAHASRRVHGDRVYLPSEPWACFALTAATRVMMPETPPMMIDGQMMMERKPMQVSIVDCGGVTQV